MKCHIELRDCVVLFIVIAVAIAGSIELFHVLAISDASRIESRLRAGLAEIARLSEHQTVAPQEKKSHVYLSESIISVRWFQRFVVSAAAACATILLSFVAASFLFAGTGNRVRYLARRNAPWLTCLAYFLFLYCWAYTANPRTYTPYCGRVVHVLFPATCRILGMFIGGMCASTALDLAMLVANRRYTKGAPHT